MKNSNDTIGNRTRDLPPCSAVPQPTAPPRAPDQDQGVHKLGDADTERREDFKSWLREWRVEGGNFISSLLVTNEASKMTTYRQESPCDVMRLQNTQLRHTYKNSKPDVAQNKNSNRYVGHLNYSYPVA